MADQANNTAVVGSEAQASAVLNNIVPPAAAPQGNALKLAYIRSYRKGGSTVFVYGVTGSEEALATYARVQGANLRKDEATGVALYFTGNAVEDGTELGLRRDGSGFYVQSDLREEAEVIEQKALDTQGKLEGLRRFAGIGKRAMADRMMAQLLG